MIIYDLWLWLLLIAEGHLPQFNRLVSGCRDENLLVSTVTRFNLLAENVGDVVFVGWELLHRRSLIETEQVDLIIHASESI